MSTSAGCLTLTQLEEIAQGATLDSRSARHLADCEACRTALQEARADATLIREVAGAARTARREPVPHGLIPGYDLLDEIHRGGQGVVYRARHRETKRTVAIKLPLAGSLRSPAQQRRFEREIELVAQLRHRNIVTLYDAGKTTTGVPGYAMEYIDGRTLDDFVRTRLLEGRDRPQTRAEIAAIVRLFATIVGAIAYAHQHGVLHRDLKPGNILVDAAGEPHVLDFGLGRVAASAAHSVTLDGEFTGTLDYAAPEQVSGVPDAVDLRADIYALGVMLYEVLTGTRPRPQHGALLERIRHISEAVVQPPSQRNRAIDTGIEAIILRCLRKPPEERYASAAALQADLENYLEGRPLEARSESRWYRLTAVARRHRWLIGGLSAAFLVLSVVAVSMGMLYRRAEGARADSDAALAEARLEKARLSTVTGRIPQAEDGLWSALLRSDAPLGVENTDPVFWALIELYAHHPCRRTWPAPDSRVLRLLKFNEDGLLLEILDGGEFWNLDVARGDSALVWDANLPPATTFARSDHTPDLFFVTDLSMAWVLQPFQGRVSTAIPVPGEMRWGGPGIDAGLVAGMQDDSIRLFRILPDGISDERLICVHDAPVRTASIVDEQKLLSADADGKLLLTDLSTDPPTVLWRRDDFDVGGGVRFTEAAGVVVYQQRPEARLAFLQLGTGQLLSVSSRNRVSQLGNVEFDAQGTYAFALHLNEAGVSQYRVADGVAVRDLLGHRERAQSLAMRQDGRCIASGTASGEIKLWDMTGHERGFRVVPFNNSVFSLGYDPTGVRVLASCDGGWVSDGSFLAIVRAEDGTIERRLAAANAHTTCATWNADGRTLVGGGPDGVLRVWDPESGQLRRETPVPGKPGIRDLCALADPDWVASAGGDGVPWLFNLRTGALQNLPAQTSRIASIAASPDGRWIAYCGEARRLWIVDTETRALVFESAEAGGVLRCLAFSADSGLLAVSGNESIVRLYRAGDWQLDSEIAVGQDPVFGLAFRPDGKVLATGEARGAIMLWDVATGKNLLKLARHTGPVFSLAYSPDGRVLASGSQDQRLILHELGYYEAHVAGNLEAALVRDAAVADSERADQIRQWGQRILNSRAE